MCTCLGEGDIVISTIEHLNAAFFCLGIDNVLVEINSSEIPIMDGSSLPFVSELLNSGIKDLKYQKKFIRIKKKIRVNEDDKWAELSPYEGFKADFTINFNHPLINNGNDQNYKFIFSSKSFLKEISPARTFCFLNKIEELKLKGFCLGGSLKCAVVLGNSSILNREGLRFKDEFVRHKILDAIGDLFSCGYNIIGSFKAHKSSHKLNNKLLQKTLNDKSTWDFITYNNSKVISRIFD